METGFILVGVFYILSSLFALSFFYYGFKIYIKSYTFNFFVRWILSYLMLFSMWLLLFFSMSLTYGYSLSLRSILEIALVFFEFLLPLVILFCLLRIEERGFDYKYLKGIFVSLIIYLVSTTYYVLSKPQISFLNDSFDIYIYSLYIILAPLFVIYSLKIVYNILIEDKRIRYPIIFLGLLISILLTGSIINGIYRSLHLIYNLIIAVLGLSIFTHLCWLEKLCTSDSKKDNVNQSDKGYSILGSISKKISARKDRFFNIEETIEKSEYALNDEVINAITNSKHLYIENRDLNQIKFMLVCASQEAENLKNKSNTAHNWALTGFTLMLVPSILILNSFANYLVNLQINLFIKSLNFMSILDQILSRFDISTHMLILIVGMYILCFMPMALLSIGDPDSKLTSWIKKRKIVSGFCELSLIIIIASVVIKWVLSIKFDPTDVSFMTNFLLILIGIILDTFGSLTISLNRKRLINANKIILDLNNKIIFYEK